MTLQDWGHLLAVQILQTDWIQWTAVIFGVAEVLFARSGKIWLYPAGIIGTALSMYILWIIHLYAESLLNLYYLIMSIYGWWYWAKKKNEPPVRPSYSNAREWTITAFISIGGWMLLYLALHYWTDSTVPIADAFISATAWAGMWLLARRKIENWVLLNISNAVAIPILLRKQLPLFAALTLFLFVIAVQGYFEWRKEIRSSQ
jgi:nicotinamide mononucleotide transporter